MGLIDPMAIGSALSTGIAVWATPTAVWLSLLAPLMVSAAALALAVPRRRLVGSLRLAHPVAVH